MSLVIGEEEGIRNVLKGRIVNWLQTPETTGGQYNSVCVVEYEPGARAKPAHAHDNGEETIYVIEGQGKVKIGEEVYKLKAGSVALFPQSIPHMVWNTGEEILKLACFYGPRQSAIEYTYYDTFDFNEFKD